MAGWCRAAGAYRPRQALGLEPGLGLGQRRRCADMHPVPVEPHAVEASLGKRPVQRRFSENLPSGAPSNSLASQSDTPAKAKGTIWRSPLRFSRPSGAMEKSPLPP